MSIDGVGQMHGDITEPLDWFAADSTQDDMTVPDWDAASPYLTTDWDGGAPTQPALSFDSSLLAGLPPPDFFVVGDHTRRAMRVYACTSVVLLAALFGMFFVFGGRFAPPPPRALHAPIITAAVLPRQNTAMPVLTPQPSLAHHPKPAYHPSVTAPPTTPSDATGLWPTTSTATTAAAASAAPVIAVPPDAPSSLWSTAP